jgi:hypothetical protein
MGRKDQPTISERAAQALIRAMLRTAGDGKTKAELVVKLRGQDINVRELGAYLTMVDRVYGRLGRPGLRSYAQARDRQLQIVTFRPGSLEIAIAEFVSAANVNLVIVCLFLKLLPNFLKGLSEALKRIAQTFATIEEGKLTRIRRKLLEKELDELGELRKLEKRERAEIVTALDEAIAPDTDGLGAAGRFADDQVVGVDIKRQGG